MINHPECFCHGHAWSEPGRWEVEPLGPVLISVMFNPPPPRQEKVRKQRARVCLRCDTVEFEDGDGTRQAKPFW